MIVNDNDNEKDITDDTLLYLGSHNLSGAAWGTLEKDGQEISIANWEIGVVFPSMKGSKEMKRNIMKHIGFKYPPKKYIESDQPFMMD